MSLGEIIKLRIEGKNEEAVTKGLLIDKSNLKKDEILQLLNELVITSWYINKKNIGKNASIEMDLISCQYGLTLTDLQKSNMKFLCPDNKKIIFKEIPFIIEYTTQDIQNETIKTFIENGFLNPIFINGNVQSIFNNLIPPYIYVYDKINISDFMNPIDINFFTEYFQLEGCVLVVKKNSFKLNLLSNIQGYSKSWDVFDTLIGRKCYYPRDIFKLVSLKSGIKNFEEIRVKCESVTLSNYDDIYKEMEKYYPLDIVNNLKIMEYEMELENVFPIIENIERVKDGDILVSDNYYSKDKILNLLKKAGLNKKVELYVTYDGKHKGYIWENIKQNHKIMIHTGDNMHSDIKSSSQYGIQGVYFETKYNEIENMISSIHPQLAKYSRMLRLRNPCYNKDVSNKLWILQSNYNIPILLMSCKYLNDYCIKYGYKKLLFCTRDCSFLIKIFKHFYPKYDCIYFHSSRIASIKKSDSYVKYIKSFYDQSDQTLYVDICGTGISSNPIFGILGYPKRFYIWYLPNLNNKLYNMDYIISIKHCNNSCLEILNYDKIGCLDDVIEDSGKFIDVRQNVKYDLSLLEYYDNILNIITSEKMPEFNLEGIESLIIKLLENLNQQRDFLFKTSNHAVYE